MSFQYLEKKEEELIKHRKSYKERYYKNQEYYKQKAREHYHKNRENRLRQKKEHYRKIIEYMKKDKIHTISLSIRRKKYKETFLNGGSFDTDVIDK